MLDASVAKTYQILIDLDKQSRITWISQETEPESSQEHHFHTLKWVDEEIRQDQASQKQSSREFALPLSALYYQ